MNLLHSFRILRFATLRRFVPAAMLGARTLAFGVLALGLAACQEKVPAVGVGAMRIVPQIDSFFVGRTAASNTFSITLLDAVGNEISDGRPITYTSSATDVFTVDAKTGIITGKSLGNGFLRASTGGRFIEAGIKIINSVANIQLLPGDFGFNVGTTRQLIPNLYAADGSTISNRLVVFSSSNSSIVSINQSGTVTAVAEGVASITASVEGKSATISATVSKEPVVSVRLTPPVQQLMRVGGQLQVTALALNNLGQAIPGRPVSWSSANPAVATVSSTGVVSALSSGQTSITAEIEGKVSSLSITVTEIPPISVSISPDTFQLASGVNRQIIPVVIDSTGRVVQTLNNRLVVWQSSNPAVAGVTASGVVTGLSAGSARINVTVDGLRSNDIVAVVSQQVASISLTPFLAQILRVGGTLQMSAVPKDNNGQTITGKTVNWFSGNPTIASVSPSGLVTAVAVGSTNITAEVDGRTQALAFTVTLVPIGSVTFTPSSETLVVGDVKQINAVVKDTAGRVLTTLVGRSVTTQTTNSPVASITTQGVVNAVAQGVAVLVFTVDGVASNDLTITVAQVATVTVSSAAGSVMSGATLQMTAVLKDLLGNVLTTSRPIAWSSNSPGIVTISPAGIVTAGTVTVSTPVIISAQINGVIGQKSINVVP